jgi:hypothetical protein
MISVEVGDELKSLTAKKRQKNTCPSRCQRIDVGMAVCMTVCGIFTIVMVVLLALNVKQFSES